MSVQLPIPASQIVDVTLDFKCLTVECPTLLATLQALVDAVCSTELPTLNFQCLTAVSTTQEFYQLVLDTLCTLQATSVPTVEPTYQLCSSDAWDCSSTLKCIDIGTETNNTATLVQALINRVNAYSELLPTLCTRITALEAIVASLQTQIDTINTNCCP